MAYTEEQITNFLIMETSFNDNIYKSFLKKVRVKIKYGLTLNSIRLKLMKAGIDISPYYWFQEGKDPSEIPEILNITSDYTVDFPGPDEMEAIERLDKGWSRSRDRIPALLDSSEKCIAIKQKGEIAAFMWINFKEFRYKSTVQELKSNEAYLTDMFTVEAFRGRNLAPFLRYKSYELLRGLGRTNLYSISIIFNKPAIKFKEKLNARKIKLIFLIRFFNKYQLSFKLKSC